MAHAHGSRGRSTGRATGTTLPLLAGILGALAGCYPDPDDLRPTQHSGSGGKTTSDAGAGSGGAPGGLGGIPGVAGRPGLGGAPGGGGGAGGKPAAGGAPGSGGRTGSGGTGIGGSGMGGAGATTASCGAPACGGNLLGTWDIVATCTSPTPDDPTNCPGETVSTAGIQRTGFITFNSDFTYSSDETDTGSYTVDTPLSCLGGATCADLDAAFQSDTQPPMPTWSSASCTSIPGGCRCVLGIVPVRGAETGTYFVSGTKVTTTPTTGGAAGSSFTDDFCVNGTTFRLIYPDSTPSAPQEAVFRKR